MTNYPPAYAHDPIEEIAPEIFMVRGCIPLNALMRITRNMAIVRNGDELTLINPIRLSPDGEAQLKNLGKITHVLRTGPMHGVDDPYYVDTYKTKFWCRPGGTTYTQTAIDEELSEGGPLPFPNAKLFCFNGTVQPESVLLLNVNKGLLLPCDCIQHYGDYRHNNLIARLLMPYIGFPKTTIIGPIWIKIMTPEGDSLKSEFERLLTWEFDALLSGHGSFLQTGAKAAVRRAFEKVYATD